MKITLMVLMSLILFAGCITVNQYPDKQTTETQQPDQPVPEPPPQPTEPITQPTPLVEPTPLPIREPTPTVSANITVETPSLPTPEPEPILNTSINVSLNVSTNVTSSNTTSTNITNGSANVTRRFIIDPSDFVTIIDPSTISAIRVSGPQTAYLRASFLIEIDGIVSSTYDSVGAVLRSGESAYPNNATSLFVGTYPSRSPRDIVIKSRVIRNRELEGWRNSVVNGRIQRKSMSIVILDSTGRQTQRINYQNAWPSQYKVTVTPDGFEEEITIVSESVEREG